MTAVEPPNVNFTGVVWDARPPEKLARDLVNGPGSVPMAEAAAAWGRMAAGLAEAVVEYDQIMKAVRGAWRSSNSGPVAEVMGKLREWLVDAANTAAHTSVKAHVQVGAYEVAKLAMPVAEELAKAEAMLKSLLASAAPLGGPLVSIAATMETQQTAAKANAARIMQTYEAATVPFSTPWHQAPPPKIATDKALIAEKQAAKTAAAGGAPRMAGLGRLAAINIPRVPTAYANSMSATTGVTTTPVEVAPITTAPSEVVRGPSIATPMHGMGQAMQLGQQEEHHDVRAAPAANMTDFLNLETSSSAAPPVLGAATEQVSKGQVSE